MTRRAGGVVIGCATITCRPPPAGSGDVRLIMLHAYELMIDRVTIDDAPARVVRRGRVVVGDDGKDVTPEPSRFDPDPAEAKAAAESADPAACASAAADAASIDTKLADGGECDELVLARRDAGTVASAPAKETASENENENEKNGDKDAPRSERNPDGTSRRGDQGVVRRRSRRRGRVARRDRRDAGHARRQVGPSPAMARCARARRRTAVALAAPGAAARPAAWFPLRRRRRVARALLARGHRRQRAGRGRARDPRPRPRRRKRRRRGRRRTRAGPAPTRRRPRGAPDFFDVSKTSACSGPKKKRFAFSSGGVPTQAHTITLAVGDFAQKQIPVSAAAARVHRGGGGGGARRRARAREEGTRATETVFKTWSRRGCSRFGEHERGGNTADADAAALSTSRPRRSATHTLTSPAGSRWNWTRRPPPSRRTLREVELYLGRAFPFPGGARFAVVPSAAPRAPRSRARRARGRGER